MRLPHLVICAVLTSGLLVAGCSDDGGGEESGGAEEIAAAEETASAEEVATWPMTGLPVEGEDSSFKQHPVLVVKIDNTSSAAPQVGLSQADLVVEELVEGGSTRLATFFYESLPDEVGPVRSMRASDIGIVTPADADVVTSGAASQTVERITRAGITFFNEGAPGMSRDGDRTAPYDLIDDLTRTAKEARAKAARPDDYLAWGTTKDLPRGRPAGVFSAIFSDGHTTTWRASEGGYVNENTFAAADDQFPADNVLVLRVEVGDAGYLDPAGNTVPETKFEGTGAATLFHDGRMVQGLWAKKDLGAPLTLTTGSGGRQEELTVPAGRTWIELVPRQGGNLSVTP